MVNTRSESTSDGMCPRCSIAVDETTDSILCKRCGCSVHQTCTRLPKEALAYMESEGVFWFCQECSKTMKKILKTKVTNEMEFKQDIRSRLDEISTAVSEMKAKSNAKTLEHEKMVVDIPALPAKEYIDNTSYELRVSGVIEFTAKPNEKPKYAYIVNHEQRQT